MRNFNLEKERAEQSEKDWKFGALSQPGIVSIPQAERAQWLPQGQLQYDQYGDFENCATRSPISHLEALLTYHYHHGMLPANKQWMQDKGYVVIRNGREVIELSHRFNSILDGTTKSGNSLKAPLESLRTDGVIPMAMLPQEDWMTWDVFYDASKITPALKQLGQDFLNRFVINYEQVSLSDFPDALKYHMIGTAGFAWPVPVNGVYPKAEGNFNHAFLIYDLPLYQIFDNYEDYDGREKVPGDYTKTLAPDYTLFEHGYRVFISAESLDKKKSIDIIQQLINALTALYNLIFQKKAMTDPLPEPPTSPQVINTPVPVVHDDKYAGGSLDDRARMCHLAATTCDDMGLPHYLKEDMLETIAGESGFNQWCVNHTTKDYGIAQFSAIYYLKEYKMTPQEALADPAHCLKIMAYNFLHGRQTNWVAYATRHTHAPMVTQLRAHYLTL